MSDSNEDELPQHLGAAVNDPTAEEELADFDPNQPAGSKGSCFLDQVRVCGADCMAFLPVPPQGQAYQGEQWAHCHLLVNMDRTGRHLSLLFRSVDAVRTASKKAAEDAARTNQPQPPKVL